MSGLGHALSKEFRKIPDLYISEAIGEAFTIYLDKAPPQVKKDPAKEYRWLHTTALRLLIKKNKRLRHFIREADLLYEPYENDTETSFENGETLRILIEELSPVLQQTVELHLQGFSYEEIAEELHTEIETVRKRLNAFFSREWQS